MFLAGFVSGFASGWIVRSSVDSTRGAAVRIVSAAIGAVDKAQRIVALEKEYFEDLIAEGRSRFQSKRKAPISIVKDAS